jgi:hypothetical protein
MLRSLGIPARMAVGFAQGNYQPPDQYIVRQQDAHAWPEVYFPGSGWVQFEPTSSQPPLVRPGESGPSTGQGTLTPQATEQANTAQETPVPLGKGGVGSGSGQPNTLVRLLVFFLAFSLLVAAGFLAYIFGLLDRAVAAVERAFRKPLPVLLKQQFEGLSLTPPGWLVRWAYLAGLAPVERTFATVYRGLRWLGMKSSPAQTPAEAADLLAGRLPGIVAEIRILLTECQRSIYGPGTGDLPRARHAAEAVRKVILQAALRQHWAQFWGIFRRASRRKISEEHLDSFQP